MTAFTWLSTLNLILGGMVFLLGLVILRENPRQRLNRVVAFMLFFGGLGSVLTAMGLIAGRTPQDSDVAATVGENLSYLWEFFFPTLLLFAGIFPRERSFIRRIPAFPLLIYVPHLFHFLLLLGVGALSGRVPMEGPTAVGPLISVLKALFDLFLAVHNSLFSLVNLGYGLVGAALLLNSYYHARVPRLREQLRVIGLGMTGCLVLYSLASSIPTLLNLEIRDWMRALLTISALTLGSGAITYSMVRYKFLDTKLLARRGILYGLASAILVGLYLTIVSKLNQVLTYLWGVDARVMEPVFLIMALILFQPAISRLEERLEKLFLRDPNDYRNVLKRLGRDLLTDIELEKMLETSVKTVTDALMVEGTALFVLAKDGPLVRSSGTVLLEDAARAQVAKRLYRLPLGEDGLRPEDVEDLADDDVNFWTQQCRAAVVFPLRSKGETVGGLLLGQKLTGTDFTAEDTTLLSTLAGQMSISVQNGLLLRQTVEIARYEEELNLARRIQSTFLPSSFPTFSRLEVHAINTPSREVGGDFYDLVQVKDNDFFLAIADVSGKGVPAALLTSMLQASLRTQASDEASVSGIVTNINSLLYRSTTQEQFATFFLAHIDEQRMRLSFSNAGHNYPLLFRKSGARSTLERGGMILGMFEGTSFEEGTVDLAPGDRLVFYTDGVNEAVNFKDEEYGEERLEELVAGMPAHLSAREMSERILTDLYAFLDGVEPQDDITVMVLRVLEPAREEREAPLQTLGLERS